MVPLTRKAGGVDSVSLFDIDKAELMEKVLERHGAVVPTRLGWASLRCIRTEMHTHGDKDRSASVHMQRGYYNCHACGLKGDGFDLMQELEGMDAQQTRKELGYAGRGKETRTSEPTFITWR